MTVKEALNRTNNLVGTAIIALAGFSFAPEIHFETETPFKIDDIALLVLGLYAIYWYNSGKNRFKETYMPVVFTLMGFLIKILAIVIEIKEKDDVGDDFGGTLLFLLSTVFIYLLIKRSKDLAAG